MLPELPNLIKIESFATPTRNQMKLRNRPTKTSIDAFEFQQVNQMNSEEGVITRWSNMGWEESAGAVALEAHGVAGFFTE